MTAVIKILPSSAKGLPPPPPSSVSTFFLLFFSVFFFFGCSAARNGAQRVRDDDVRVLLGSVRKVWLSLADFIYVPALLLVRARGNCSNGCNDIGCEMLMDAVFDQTGIYEFILKVYFPVDYFVYPLL